MNAQQEAIALFQFLESRGLRPSTREIGRMLRASFDLRFTEGDLRSWLRSFQSAVASATQSDASPTQKTSTPDAVPTQSDASPTRLRARNKVSLVTSYEETEAKASASRPEQADNRALPLVTGEVPLAPPLVQPVERIERVTPPPFPAGLPPEIPAGMDILLRVAETFLRAFGNCRSPEAVAKHRPAYAHVLGAMRSRRANTATAWEAFCSALAARDGKPLFGNAAKLALSYLPPTPLRAVAGDPRPPRYAYFDGTVDPPVVPRATRYQLFED